jgi:hypothetical protein
MTLDLYGHLYGDRLDEVADRMDAARERSRSQAGSSAPGGRAVTTLRPRRS